MRASTLVMARAPVPGRCKTRLQPLLGPAGCARLQAQLIAHTLSACPPGTSVACDGLVDAGDHTSFDQQGAHLGERLSHAVDRVGAPVLVVGTDLPSLTRDDLRAADRALDDADVVFGPAADGGYWLIGLRQAAPELFAIDPALWGGPGVLAASLARADAAGLRSALLDERRDLDTPADARALRAEPRTPPAIAACLSASSSRP